MGIFKNIKNLFKKEEIESNKEKLTKEESNINLYLPEDFVIDL